MKSDAVLAELFRVVGQRRDGSPVVIAERTSRQEAARIYQMILPLRALKSCRIEPETTDLRIK